MPFGLFKFWSARHRYGLRRHRRKGEERFRFNLAEEGETSEMKSQTRCPQAADLLVEFLEVAITSVVFFKGVYPAAAFERQRFLNLVVHRARHPDLLHYIRSSSSSLLPFFRQGSVDRVAVTFFNTENMPIERFVFKVILNQSCDFKMEESDLEFSLRSLLIKLSLSQSLTKSLPHECRWEVTAYFSSLPQSSIAKEAELWISTKAKLWHQPPVITPVKSINPGFLNVQVYLEHLRMPEPMLQPNTS